jgi:choline dehydrogenase
VTADYVIVGAGSAGCVLADRLSADGSQVVLLEAGPPATAPETKVPILFTRTFGGEHDWDFTTVPQEHLAGRRIPYTRGKGLGGSSLINAQLWTTGHRADYEAWGWSYDDVLPWFERIEAERMKLAGVRYPSPVTADFVSACARAGHAPAGTQPDGYTLVRATHDAGLRWSSADAYLRPRPNLRVRSGVLVRRVLFDGVRAIGVELGDEVVHGREVILAAGAVGSPHLLMRSGVGPAAHLGEHGVPLVADVPGVGQSMSDHLIVPIAFAGNGFTSPGVDARPAEIERYLRDREGPLDSILSEALLFLRTRDGLPGPDIEIALLMMPYGETERHGLALGVILLQPESRGTISLRSADPHAAPVIDPRYLSAPADLDTLVAGIQRAQEIVAQPVFNRWLGRRLSPDDPEECVRRNGSSIFHPVGTCALGSVLDPDFRVHGTEGLRVVDAAAMPGNVRGHTHAPVTMLAEKAAASIIAARNGTPGSSASRCRPVAGSA